MFDPKDIIYVDGPMPNEPQRSTSDFSQGIIYSVSLENGQVVTAPERFPEATASKSSEASTK